MTYNYSTYEFTAFSEQQLLSQGGNGSDIGCGDTFTMPTYADTCLSVTDNDAYLSGDECYNENSTDHYGQHASIMKDGVEAGNGGQIYAEVYHWVHDQHGNWYVMIEIEQEGTGDDYFTFFTGSGYTVPPQGSELTVGNKCDVSGNWVNFNNLDAGDKTPPATGPVWEIDPDTCIYTIEAEDLDLHGFKTVHGDNASGGELVKLTGHEGTLSTDFGGESGVYNLSIHVQDEYDGCSTLKVLINGEIQKVIILNQNTDGAGSDNGHFSSVTLDGLDIAEGDKIEIRAFRDSGEWVRIDTLKFEQVKDPEPVWEIDPDTCIYTIEAEDLDLHGFKVVHGDNASGGELVKMTGHEGKISTDFGGESGVYNLIIHAQDECDGQSTLKVFVNGEFQQTIKLNQDNNGGGSDNGHFSAFTLNGLEIATGDKVEIFTYRDSGEWVRVDALKFEQVKFEMCDDPDAVKLDFEGFTAGNVLTNQIDGLTITATGGSGDAMIFDSQNPTGGDHDLETQVTQLGNVLIVSEDGDSSDPDDAIGGKISFDFDRPATVFDLKVIDTEEGGTITLTLEDGSTQTFDIPKLVNGGVGQVVMDVENVVSMDVHLDGSGAIDDLCYVPGAATPPPGSLSGTYFCDDNRDGVDNGAPIDPDVANKTVTLLQADGVTPALDADGNTVAPTVTNAEGNYRFDNLAAGSYVVMFASSAAEGKEFIEANAGDDAIDSDVIDLVNGKTAPVEVFAGLETENVDAGVKTPNQGPTAVDDQGVVCVGTTTVVELLFNDTDVEDANSELTVLSISDADETATVGQSITLASGAVATLNENGSVTINAVDAAPDLLVGDSIIDEFDYILSDSEGGTDMGSVDVGILGALNTVDSIAADLAEVGHVSFTLDVDTSADGVVFTQTLVDVEFPATDLGQVLSGLEVFEIAFCLSILTPIESSPVVNEFGISVLNADTYTAAIAGAVQPPIADLGFNPENVDNVNWLINEAETLIADGVTEGTIQRAIWQLLDGGADNAFTSNAINNFLEGQDRYAGTGAAAQELVDMALMNDGFVAESGDMVALILDPKVNGVQPFLIGVEFDDLAKDCAINDFMF